MTRPDIHSVLERYLTGPGLELNTRHTDLPAELETNVPLVHFQRIGGPARQEGRGGTDEPRVVFNVFDATEKGARTLADTVREALDKLNGIAGDQIPGVIIFSSEEETGPEVRPYENTKVKRVGWTHRFSLIGAI